jgi:colanic acid/amylovoran biosynthesis glycosyltransferase
MKIGLILASLPNYSETFLETKISYLVKNKFNISLFVNRRISNNKIKSEIPILFQPNINNPIFNLYNLLSLFLWYPLVTGKFVFLERDSNRDWNQIIINLIINSHILKKKLDWVHFEFATLSIRRENVAKAIGAKSAVSLRGFDICLYPYQHPGCFNLLWEKIDKVHAISNDLYQEAKALGLSPNVQFQKITPAINVDYFKTTLNKDVLHNPLRILTVGRLTWKKGIEYGLKACESLKQKGIDFEYRIVGEGNYRESIIFAINQLGLSEKVILKGQLAPEEVKNEMKWADIYIQPSIQEGFCNAVLEAQAMGLLCIVTDAEGLSENIINEKTGWVIPKRSSTALGNKIQKIYFENILELNKIRRNATHRINKEFNIENQIEEFKNFYLD